MDSTKDVEIASTKNLETQELIRVVTRSLGFLIPLGTLCVALFMLDDVRDNLVGFIAGAVSMSGVFMYKKQEEKKGE